MDVRLAQFLISASGEKSISDAVEMLGQRVEAVTGLGRLRKTLTADEARAVWKAAQLRRAAADKLADNANVLILEQAGFEMSSSTATSSYHAEILSSVGTRSIVDVCAGIGIDTIAFARAGIAVTAFEVDETRAILLRENVRRAGVEDLVEVLSADVTAVSLPRVDAAFFDPARRGDAHRWVRDDEQTSPPLSFVESLAAAGIPNILTKLTPAVNRAITERYPGALEIVSVKGECKEALLRSGQLATEPGIAAVLLPSHHRLRRIDEARLSENVGAYIWEPDPAVIRAGLTGSLASTLGGWQRDPHVDYFFTNEPGLTPFATCYRVLDSAVYSRKGLSNLLAGAGKVILKQRGFPQSIDEVRSKLKLTGSGTAVVILASFNNAGYAYLVERQDSGEAT